MPQNVLYFVALTARIFAAYLSAPAWGCACFKVLWSREYPVRNTVYTIPHMGVSVMSPTTTWCGQCFANYKK